MFAERLSDVLDLPARLGGALMAAEGSGDSTFWLPRQGSKIAKDVDFAWDAVYWLSIFFFVLIMGIMAYFMWRYRSGRMKKGPEPSPTHHMPLEVFWSAVPTALVVWLFWTGYATFQDMAVPPQNSYQVNVIGQKWNWLFEYPDGCITSELFVPIDVPVELTVTSDDVLHSFFVPEFRVKRDVIPGRFDKLWFEPTETGEFDIFCTEYCGKDHSAMLSKAHVFELGDLQTRLAAECDLFRDREPTEVGELLYNRLGCKRCHSLDGESGIGPTFQGLWGREEVFVDGTSVVADENYIMSSIYDPKGQVVAGYDPVMPSFRGRLDDKEVRAIISYIKTLN